MIEVIPFHVKHLTELTNRKDIFKNDPELDERVRMVSGHPLCFSWTLTREGKILGIVGGHQIWKGVVEIWSLLSEDVLTIPIAFHKAISRILDFHEENIPVHRYQATVQADFTQGQRWMEVLGFKYEGLLKKYGVNQEDYVLFARIR
jgi:RimJ/RimL family protein N-acetyltransferase